MEIVSANIASPVGVIAISGSLYGIRSVIFLQEGEIDETIPECLKSCAMQLGEYFSGLRNEFSLKLDPQGTDFQLKVWEKLLLIPFGKTISYLELAQMTGKESNTRAVGNANGKNKINIIVPCHRVIGSNGKLIGYGGGLWRKEFLLKHEMGESLPGLFAGH